MTICSISDSDASGRAVAEAAHFYKLEPGNVVVFHDEAELPPGKVRLKTGGGNARTMPTLSVRRLT